MDESPLDDVDRSILHYLQENARNTVTDIANEVGVSGNTVRNRMEELEEKGIIKGYSVDIDYKEAGLDLHFAFTCTAPISKREELAREILEIPGVIEVREFMTGQENIYLEALGTDAEDITRIAHDIDDLGAKIHIEKLIRNDFSHSFGPFSQPSQGSG